MYDILSDGASVCHNEEGNVNFASCTTRRESEDIVGEDTIIATVPTVVAGDVGEPTVEAVDVGGVAHLDPLLDDADVEAVDSLSNSDDVTISENVDDPNADDCNDTDKDWVDSDNDVSDVAAVSEVGYDDYF